MRGVSKQNVIKKARLKLIKIFTFQNKAFAFKRAEMRDRRLATKAKLKGGQMQNSTACYISNRIFLHSILHLKIASTQKRLGVLCSLSIILAISTRVWFFSFHNSILLRNARGGKLLINPMLKAKLIKKSISELSPIVTANSFQAVGMLIVQPQSQELKSAQILDLCSTRRKPKSNGSSRQQ
jgi:hypothetical protein